MTRTILSLAAFGLAATLAACGQKTEEAQAPAAAPAAEEAQMGGMAVGRSAMTAQGTGTVTAVDPAANTITIDHAPIAEANWPQMTMAFKAPPEMVQQVQAGDRVAFDLKLEGGAGEITAIRKE